MKYSVVEISGRQYLVEPGKAFEVDKLNAEKTLSSDKVLLLVDGKKVQIGTPYLKEALQFDILETVKKKKVRVATYKAKSNYRRVNGQKREMTKIVWIEKSAVKKD